MLRFSLHRGNEAAPHLDAIAALRCEVFADWPYLYEGDVDYERRYLARYLDCPRALCVLAREGDEIVGVSTGVPLLDDNAGFQRPFIERGIDPARVFYCGESVLRRAFRGQGAGHAFFDHREAEAQGLGLPITAFCAVDRDPDDPRRPPDHRGNDVFWTRRGYRRQPGMHCELDWPEPGRGDCTHRLTFWLRGTP
ncbi:GNAT family N-acetyltransferase [Lysobacter sp. CAU 1642]|uniref:GNAT family N-acetyltransferase n=1 Tax=Pseudomarimonas salicorniae TaxID=2933270 RepID=A0ABT0GM00_9GAMM|nr:GNAT family N-acetyltransferase [Lysobacter sp. CAU 1642]